MRHFLLFLFAVPLFVTTVHASEAQVTNLSVVPIKSGPNAIPRLAPWGADGLILDGYRGNGNAHGYDVFSVMLLDNNIWNIVPVQTFGEPKSLPKDTLRNDPLTGEDNATSVWFARGNIDKNPAFLLLIARRDLSHVKSLYDAVPATIEIYRLARTDEGVGTPPYLFEPVSQRRSLQSYQNSECAMAQELHLPLTGDASTQCSSDTPH